MKFTDEQATIQAKFQEKDRQLIIRIFNTGKQIPEDNLIFDKFYQSRNQNIRKPLGSGLGLAICRKMQAHRGNISARNLEIGVEFQMILNKNNGEKLQ